MSEAAASVPSEGRLGAYAGAVRRRKWTVLAVAAVEIGCVTVLSLLEEPTYRARTQIVVGEGNGPLQPEAGEVENPRAAAVLDLVESNVVAGNVIGNLKLRETPESLLERISVSSPQPGILNVSVVDHSPQRARQIVQEIGLVFAQLVTQRFGATTGGQPPLVATIWDPAHGDPDRVGPQRARNVSLAAAVGIALGLLAALLHDRLAPARTRRREERAAAADLKREAAALRSAERALAQREAKLSARAEELAARARSRRPSSGRSRWSRSCTSASRSSTAARLRSRRPSRRRCRSAPPTGPGGRARSHAAAFACGGPMEPRPARAARRPARRRVPGAGRGVALLLALPPRLRTGGREPAALLRTLVAEVFEDLIERGRQAR